MKKKAKPARNRQIKALAILLLALLLGVTLPNSGLLDFAVPLWRPCTLSEQIQAANLDEPVGSCPAGYRADIIVLNEDVTLWARLPSIRSEITIEGNGHTISGDGKAGLFSVLVDGNLKISNARLVRGAGGQLGGAIQINGGKVKLVDVTVSDSADDRGSAIILQDGRLFIRESNLAGQADIRSHAITNEDGQVSIVDSTIEGFNFDFRGGAIINNGIMTITQSVIRNNSAMSGAAVYNLGKLDIRETVFSENTAEGGGAISSWRAEVYVSNSKFTNNRAEDGPGGAIFSRETPTRIERSEFKSNSSKSGGAIGGMDAWLAINDSHIVNNSAEENGGGLSLIHGTLRVTNSDFEGNDAANGGGIYSENATIILNESRIRRNRADIGGGFHITGGKVTLTDNVIRSNCATSQGAAVFRDEAVELRESGTASSANKIDICDG